MEEINTMNKGDILEAVTEPNFIIEVIDLDESKLEIFVGKVIQFPEKSNRWANTQTICKIGRYLKRDFIPSIVTSRDFKLKEIGL